MDFTNVYDQVNSLLNYTIVKLIFFIIFIIFFYNVIMEILLFFGIEGIYVYMYMGWLVFLLLLVVILPLNYGIKLF